MVDSNQRRMPNIAETSTPRASPSPVPRVVLPGQVPGSNKGQLPSCNNGVSNPVRGAGGLMTAPGASVIRKYSMAPSSVAGSTRKLSSSATTTRGDAVLQVENTFQLEPHPDCHFNASRVEKMLHSLMETMLGGVQYDAQTAPELAQALTEDIKMRVKLLKYDRHKIVVHVILGSLNGQGMQTVSRSVWDHQVDNYASACYNNRTLFAVTMVHATYFE
ncbi:tctex1 domain-containing protein 2-like [Acanthaster planci]|uniref:Tctex1 domain-containing protein 2-like n=1 Tax=Acanthaster planci TaxID=133434 RepID=A0A8B7ZAJ4_ACAPL|nr:tctex1 domain-containing protein 2-like [Acanthaster planci]